MIILRTFFKTLCASALLAPTFSPALAQSANLAQDGLEKSITQLSADPASHGFELGMLQTLRAVEKTLQARYDYNLSFGRLGLPVLRLDTSGHINPSPKTAGPDTLSAIIDTFVTDVTQARATLESATTAGVAPFELTLQDIWFDINSNGTREDAESAVATLGPIVLGGRAYRDFTQSDAAETPLTVRFDHADHAWLLAYTHMLSGFGNLYMAFDPTPVLRDLAEKRDALANVPEIPNHYDIDALKAEIATLEVEQDKISTQLDEVAALTQPLYDERNELYDKQRQTEDEAIKAEIQDRLDQIEAELDPLQEQRGELSQSSRLIRNELDAAKAKLPSSPNQLQQMVQQQRTTIDLVYVILTSLDQQPDPARIKAAHQDWLAMIRHNRQFWTLLADETDNDREWVPNPQQTSALPLDIPPRIADGWQNILADAEAVLEGKLLIPHPLLPEGHGISLPAYVEDPAPLDLMDWIHGIGAYRYAARGPRITGQSWQAFQRLTQGNAGGFALFLN